jgi:glycosyltransferase involved in cell wall biosynthesis
VLVVSFAYPPVVGGLPQQAHLLNRALRDKGVSVTVVTIRVKGYPEIDTLDGVPIYRLWTLRGEVAGYRSRIYPWLLSLGVFLIVHRHDYNVIHIHQASYPAAICIVLGKLLGKRTLIRITGSGETGNIAFLKKWWILGSVVRLIIRHTDCFISLTEDITNELLADGIPLEKIVHIHNGVDARFFSPSSSHTGDRDRKIVLGVGRLTEEKGFDILIRAWAKVIQDQSSARLIIVGDGPELSSLKSLVQQLGIAANVSFEGNRENIYEHLSNVDIFILPSRNEGMSNALLEAMSMERTCIASDIPANRAVLTPEVDGLLFKKNDADELALRILQVFKQPELAKQLGRNARQKILAQFSIDEVSKMYMKLYSQLSLGTSLKT